MAGPRSKGGFWLHNSKGKRTLITKSLARSMGGASGSEAEIADQAGKLREQINAEAKAQRTADVASRTIKKEPIKQEATKKETVKKQPVKQETAKLSSDPNPFKVENHDPVSAVAKTLNVHEDEADKMVGAVRFYSEDGYRDISKYRKKGIEEFPGVAQASETLDKFLEVSPKYKGTIYRGVSKPSAAFLKNLKPGSEFTTDGVASWSASATEAKRFATGRVHKSSNKNPVIMKVVTKGRGVNVSHLSSWQTEKEVLVQHNTKYKVVNVKKDSDGFTRVEVEEL